MATKIIRRLGALLLASALAVFCTGCGAGGDASSADTGSESAKRTDLSIRIQDAFSTLDPQNWSLNSDQRLCSQIYEPLYRIDDDGEEIPVLATAYKISDDGKTVVFTLRDGVAFSNGDKLTASDVKFSIERTKKSAYLSTNVATVSSVDANDGAGTVTVNLSAPTPGIIGNLSSVSVVNQKYVEEKQDEKGLLGFNACGTGPYVAGDYTLDDHITLTANPDYRDGEASVKTLTFHVIKDENTAVTALQAGELDVAALSTSNWDSLKDSPDLRTQELTANHVTYLILNTEKAPFDNKLVRQAVASAVNRDDIIAMAMGGRATPTYTLATHFMTGYAEIEPKFTYDPDRAKELLAQAGYPNGLDIGETLTLSGAYFEDVMEVVQQELAAVGITCTISGLEANTMINNCLTGSFTMADLGQTNTNDMTWLSTYYATDMINTMNMARYSNADVDAQLGQAAVNMDPAARSALYKKILEAVEEDSAYIPLFNGIKCVAWAADLNYTPQITSDLFYGCNWN